MCWVSYKFGIEFGVVELEVGFFYIIITVHNDYCASFISFCYDDVIPVFEFVQRINFTFCKVAVCMRFVFVGGGGGVYVPFDRFNESFYGMVYIFWLPIFVRFGLVAEICVCLSHTKVRL